MDNIRGRSAATVRHPGLAPALELTPVTDDLFAASPVPHLVVSIDGLCEAHNVAFNRLLGVPERELAGVAYVDLLAFGERLVVPVPGAPLEQRFTTTDGDVWALVAAGSLPSGRRLLSVQDVTARKRTEHGLVHAAMHDSLTNLPNRRLLHDRLSTALARASRSHETVAVLFLDLDGFKAVNDTHGHQTGDALLVAIAGHLAAGLRACDTVARLGGDEFVVVCSDLNGEESLGALTQRVQEAVRQPISVHGVPTSVSASLGVAVAGPHARTPAALLRLADVAMYHAKRNPGVPYVLADETLAAAVAQVADVSSGGGGDAADRRAPGVSSRTMEDLGGDDRPGASGAGEGLEPEARGADRLGTELSLAIETDQLTLHYQPIVALDGRLVALEALLRWPHPRLGPIPPQEVVAVAERSSLGPALQDWVLNRAFVDAARWCDPLIRLSINVSACEARRPGFSTGVLALLAQHGLPATSLGLEVSEDMFAVMPQEREELDQLRRAGVGVIVDGFGRQLVEPVAPRRPGVAGPVALSSWPVDSIKVDAWLLEAAGEVARASGRRIGARAVETAADLDAARQLDVDTAQGYFLARPAPLDDFHRVIAQRRVDLPA